MMACVPSCLPHIPVHRKGLRCTGCFFAALMSPSQTGPGQTCPDCRRGAAVSPALHLREHNKKTALYLSIKCGNLAESQGFEKQFCDFYALFQSPKIHFVQSIHFFKTLCAYCFGCFQRGCCQIAVSLPRIKRADGLSSVCAFPVIRSRTAGSAQAARRRAARKPPAHGCAAGGRGAAAPTRLNPLYLTGGYKSPKIGRLTGYKPA